MWFKKDIKEKKVCLRFDDESGRTLLEIIAVCAIMGVLSVSTILFYRQIMNSHEAETFYEDFRTRALLYAGKKEKSVFSTAISEKTTYGNLSINYKENTPAKGYFALELPGLKTALCNILVKKNWIVYTTANKDSKNEALSAQRIYIDGKAYAPEALPKKCPSGDNVTFKVSYKSTYAAANVTMPDLCSSSCTKPCQACGASGECYLLCEDCDEITGTCPEPPESE